MRYLRLLKTHFRVMAALTHSLTHFLPFFPEYTSTNSTYMYIDEHKRIRNILRN